MPCLLEQNYTELLKRKNMPQIFQPIFINQKYMQNVLKNEPEYAIFREWEKYKAPFLFSTNGRSYLEQLKTKSGIWFLDVRNPGNHSDALKRLVFSGRISGTLLTGILERPMKGLKIVNMNI